MTSCLYVALIAFLLLPFAHVGGALCSRCRSWARLPSSCPFRWPSRCSGVSGTCGRAHSPRKRQALCQFLSCSHLLRFYHFFRKHSDCCLDLQSELEALTEKFSGWLSVAFTK